MKRLTAAALLLAVTASAGAETLKLKNGDVINAPITAQDGESVTINHPSLGETKIKRDTIEGIYKDADAYKAASDEQAAADKKAEAAAERAADEGMFGTGFLKGWDRRLELGLTGASGNSENLNFRAAFFGKYEDEEDRWLWDMVYRRATSGGDVTENKFYSTLTKDWLVPEEDYFFFATGRFDWDDLQDWDYRLSGFGGAGYQFVKNDTWDVRGRAGLGGNQEFGSVDEGFTLEALVGVEADYKINEDQSIAFTNYLYPSLEEAGDFRNVTTLDYVIAIDRDKGMDLKIGLTNEYDSKVGPGTKRNDVTYYISLLWKF